MLQTRAGLAGFVAVWLMLAGNSKAMDIRAWPLPAMSQSAQADLALGSDNGLLLSWVEKTGESAHRLRYSVYPTTSEQPQWQPAQTIAGGKDWFVNWADTPHLVRLPNGTLWAHWLRRNGDGKYNYGVALVHSADDGKTWSAPIRVEPEGASNDYGFVSLWAHSVDKLGLAWLDSRQKPAANAGDSHDHDAHAGAAMMLRAAIFDDTGKRAVEWPLDVSTCDCCPTSAAMTSRGPVIVYRGRSADEVRDTRLVRYDGKTWTAPISVHADGWKFAGCPVNGPAVVAQAETVWAAWYTEADGQPSLRIARSNDAGDRFETPLVIAEGRELLGRVALAMDANTVWVAYLVESAAKQALWLAQIDGRSGSVIDRQKVADLTARGRASGLPKLQAVNGTAWLVWTDGEAGKTSLHGISVRPSRSHSKPAAKR